jgi:AAA15 family ATPase/GTPase
MLLRFSVSNFGSLRDKQELSMIASGAIKDDPGGLIEAPQLRNEKVLPAAVIYGANASGKSNFVKAFAHMQMLVRDSHREGEPGTSVQLRPFLLDPKYVNKSCNFGLDFILEDERYYYLFEATTAEFISESLYSWRGGPRSTLFERRANHFKFGRTLRGENRIIEKFTRPNSLFLSAAAQNNHPILSQIFKFIISIRCQDDADRNSKIISESLIKNKTHAMAVRFISGIEPSIHEYKIEE